MLKNQAVVLLNLLMGKIFMNVIETERLILRTWYEEDVQEYYRINQDPKVIEFLRGPLTMVEVKDFILFMNQQFSQIGYTLWAAEEKSSGKLMGFIEFQIKQ